MRLDEKSWIIQREAAKKNCGIPLQKYEGFRAAIIKAQYKVEITHSFKRSDFFPSPNVDTCLLYTSPSPRDTR